MTRAELVSAVLKLHADGKSHGEVAKLLGVTRNVCLGIVSRARGYVRPRGHRGQRPASSETIRKRAERAASGQRDMGDWDQKLFEPYAVRKARLALERQRS